MKSPEPRDAPGACCAAYAAAEAAQQGSPQNCAITGLSACASARCAVPAPVHRPGRGQQDQQPGRQHPHRERERVQPGHPGRQAAAAFATIPVPMTTANQFGPRSRKTSPGRSRSFSISNGRGLAPAGGARPARAARIRSCSCGPATARAGHAGYRRALDGAVEPRDDELPAARRLEPGAVAAAQRRYRDGPGAAAS